MTVILYFGSFNPLHCGHLQVAEQAMMQCRADELWFVVSPQNPMKANADLLPEELRLKMVEETLKDYPQYGCCRVEYSLPRPSYTIDTVRVLKALSPDTEYWLLVGSDTLQGMPTWKNYDELVQLCTVISYPRKGYKNTLAGLPNHMELKGDFLPVSSTQLRAMKAGGQPFTHLVPNAVNELWVG